jgi:hypothetical protein
MATYWAPNKIYTMPSKDPEKIKKWRREWYERNKDKQIKRQHARRKELAQWLWEYKRSLSCADCGMSFKNHPERCDFHHLDPNEKEDVIYIMAASSRAAALREIAKCTSLCACCHRTRHRDMYTNMLVSEDESEPQDVFRFPDG